MSGVQVCVCNSCGISEVAEVNRRDEGAHWDCNGLNQDHWSGMMTWIGFIGYG